MVTGKRFPWLHTGGQQYRVEQPAREVPGTAGYRPVADTGEVGHWPFAASVTGNHRPKATPSQ